LSSYRLFRSLPCVTYRWGWAWGERGMKLKAWARRSLAHAARVGAWWSPGHEMVTAPHAPPIMPQHVDVFRACSSVWGMVVARACSGNSSPCPNMSMCLRHAARFGAWWSPGHVRVTTPHAPTPTMPQHADVLRTCSSVWGMVVARACSGNNSPCPNTHHAPNRRCV
jgi:hypothetical protein